jgi:hypothetical protein
MVAVLALGDVVLLLNNVRVSLLRIKSRADVPL